MNFTETIKSLGCVQPCPVTSDGQCATCHGTGQFLDLAPLLAKPNVLVEVVHELLFKQYHVDRCQECGDVGLSSTIESQTMPTHIIGPQHANNLIYEIARQLEATVVTCSPVETTFIGHPAIPESLEDMNRWKTTKSLNYHLSIPIPDLTPVLFVTDKLDESEMNSIIGIVNNPIRYLKYILALVSDKNTIRIRGAENFNVISLHQEKI